MGAESTGQVSQTAAEVYEAVAVPALFREWAPRTAKAARVAPGQRVLDVACGTGIVAREAALRVAPGGSVVGVDRNPGMLAVARAKAPDVDFREGRAENLPLSDGEFDAVTCQFGLMFFDDRVQALQEMRRVAKPRARIAVVTWDAAERQPDGAIIGIVERAAGPDAADEMRAPFSLGDPRVVVNLFARAGMTDATVETIVGTQRYPSTDAYVHGILHGWTLADKLDERQQAEISAQLKQILAPHTQRDGALVMPAPAHVTHATRV